MIDFSVRIIVITIVVRDSSNSLAIYIIVLSKRNFSYIHDNDI